MVAKSVADDDVERWLMASAAHEMEAPLTRLSAAIHHRVEGAAGDRFGENKLQDELRLVRQLTAIVRGIGYLVRADVSGVGSVRVHDAIELALKLTWREVASRACVTRRYRAIPNAIGHQATLARVMAVLLRNAAHSIPTAMPAANRISIDTGVGEDGRICIDVVDTGVGIAPEDLSHVFEPFFTSKARPAPGLGLAGAVAAIESFGGTITADSRLGYGSRLRISLVEDGVSSGSVFSDVRTEPTPLRRVLVVSSSLAQAGELGSILGCETTTVTLAEDDDALERLALGEVYEWIVWDAESWYEGACRERVALLAPDVLARTFPVGRPRPSG